jgi:hypothetical protein
MLEMLVVANSAFAIIKQTIQNGRELSSAGAAISKFVSAEEQLKQDLHKKKNSIWTNFLGKEDNDLEEFMALKRYELRTNNLESSCSYMAEQVCTMTMYLTVLMHAKLEEKLELTQRNVKKR